MTRARLRYTWQFMPQTAALPSTRRSLIAVTLASVLLLGLGAGGFWAASQVAMVPSAVPAYMAVEDQGDNASLSSSTHAQQLRLSSSGPIWREITEAQRQVLMPLRERWDSMGALAKRRWLVLADRYPQMDTSERTKLVSRMNTWASLSAQQRNQARLNFESTKRLSAQELQEKWDAYQALSDAEKKRLAEQAQKAKNAKKSKRRLARIPKPKAQAVQTPQMAQPIEAPAVTSHPVPVPTVTVTQPVVTPYAAPAHNFEPLTPQQPGKAEVPAVLTQPVSVPEATPAISLPPLDVSQQPVTPAPAAVSPDPYQPWTPSDIHHQHPSPAASQ